MAKPREEFKGGILDTPKQREKAGVERLIFKEEKQNEKT
jgi:hypothetical protein